MSKLGLRSSRKTSPGSVNNGNKSTNKSKRRHSQNNNNNKNDAQLNQLLGGGQTTLSTSTSSDQNENELIQCMHVYAMEGTRLKKLKNYNQAIVCFNRALSVHKTLHRGDGETQADMERKIGSCYLEMKQYEDALKHCRRALRLYIKFLGHEHGKTVKARDKEEYITLMLDPDYHEYLKKANEEKNPATATSSGDDDVFAELQQMQQMQREMLQQDVPEMDDYGEHSSSVVHTTASIPLVQPTEIEYVDASRLMYQQNHHQEMKTSDMDDNNFADQTIRTNREVTFHDDEATDDYDYTATTEQTLSTIEEVDESTIRLRIDLALVDVKLGLPQKAQERLMKALSTAERFDCSLEIAEICELLGDIVVQDGAYNDGRKYYKEALKALEEDGDGRESERYDKVLAKMMGIAGLF